MLTSFNDGGCLGTWNKFLPPKVALGYCVNYSNIKEIKAGEIWWKYFAHICELVRYIRYICMYVYEMERRIHSISEKVYIGQKYVLKFTWDLRAYKQAAYFSNISDCLLAVQATYGRLRLHRSYLAGQVCKWLELLVPLSLHLPSLSVYLSLCLSFLSLRKSGGIYMTQITCQLSNG